MFPNVDSEMVEPAKVRDHLLSPVHPVGRFKAPVFEALGYSASRWERLQAGLLALARMTEATPGRASPYGKKFQVSGILCAPSGREGVFVTVWLGGAEHLPWRLSGTMRP